MRFTEFFTKLSIFNPFESKQEREANLAARLNRVLPLLVLLSSLLFTQNIMGNSTWVLKRELGAITVWKTLTQKEIRATSQWFDKPSVLANLASKEEVVKNFEADKKRALENFGITKWQADSYEWDKGKSLTVKGTYINRDGQKVSFVEKHIFREKEKDRGVLLLVNETGKNISPAHFDSLYEEVLKRQGP